MIKAYPKFLLEVILGLMKALMTTPEGVLFTLLGVFLCWAVGVPLGISIALGLYTIMFILGNHVSAFLRLLNSKFDLILRIISDRHGQQ